MLEGVCVEASTSTVEEMIPPMFCIQQNGDIISQECVTALTKPSYEIWQLKEN